LAKTEQEKKALAAMKAEEEKILAHKKELEAEMKRL
jgi:hypothetical protein